MIELLAITPPTGDVSPSIVDAWLDTDLRRHRFAVLLREPGRTPAEILDPSSRLTPLRERCRRDAMDVLIGCNTKDLDPKISKLVEASVQGLQLRGDPSVSMLREVRARFASLCVGRSCHGEPQPGGSLVDYTCLAPIFAPRTPSPGVTKTPVGVAALRRWSEQTQDWLVALGGVTPATAGQCRAAGARGLASIRTFFGEPAQVAEDVQALCAAHAAPPPQR